MEDSETIRFHEFIPIESRALSAWSSYQIAVIAISQNTFTEYASVCLARISLHSLTIRARIESISSRSKMSPNAGSRLLTMRRLQFSMVGPYACNVADNKKVAAIFASGLTKATNSCGNSVQKQKEAW
jgi:hypothetical protein